MMGAIGVVLSLNDPRWGRGSGDEPREPEGGGSGPRRPQGGPPDLEDLWRDLNRRLSGLLGRGSRQDNDGPRLPGGGSSGRGASVGIGLIAAVALLIWLASGFFIVPEGQQAVILTFGKLSSATNHTGFQWRMPYPIQSHEIVNVSAVRTVEVGYRGGARTKVAQEALMLTDDENIIDIQFAVQYRIREDGAADFVLNNRAPEEAVKQAAETSMREVVGRKNMDSVLYESREAVAADVQRLVQKVLDRYSTGILVLSVAIQQAQPPQEVQAAFDDANKANQDRERQINEGQAYANDVIPKARGTSSRLLQEAEGYRQRVVETASGDAARFKAILVEYSRAPVVTRDRMYIDTMQSILQNATKVLVDVRQSSPLLYLPLDQILRQTGSDPAAGGSSRMASPASPPTPTDPPGSPTADRVRDATRARDRETR